MWFIQYKGNLIDFYVLHIIFHILCSYWHINNHTFLFIFLLLLSIYRIYVSSGKGHHCNQCLSALNLWVIILLMAMCARYNIMWYWHINNHTFLFIFLLLLPIIDLLQQFEDYVKGIAFRKRKGKQVTIRK
jgi:hypothetical protein